MNNEKPHRNHRTGQGAPPEAPAAAPLPEEARDLIGAKLRQAYGAKLSEPVPDRFAQLLKSLASKG